MDIQLTRIRFKDGLDNFWCFRGEGLVSRKPLYLGGFEIDGPSLICHSSKEAIRPSAHWHSRIVEFLK